MPCTSIGSTHGSEMGCTLFLHLLSPHPSAQHQRVCWLPAAGCHVAAQAGCSVRPPLAHSLPQMSCVLWCVHHIAWNHRFLDSFLQSGHLGSVLLKNGLTRRRT